VKLSVSLPDDDVAFLDARASRDGGQSRSAVLHEAVSLLRRAELQQEYAAALTEWAAGPDSGVWDAATGDGLVP